MITAKIFYTRGFPRENVVATIGSREALIARKEGAIPSFHTRKEVEEIIRKNG